MSIKQFLFKLLRPKVSDTLYNSKDAYVKIMQYKFSDINYAQSIIDDVIVYICNNNYNINVGDVIMLFKDRSYTIDEYFILIYKLGNLTQIFAEDPSSYLNRALLDLSHRFSKEKLVEIQSVLDNYYHTYNENMANMLSKANEINNMISEAESAVKGITDEDTKANKLIEDWILKSKSNGNI